MLEHVPQDLVVVLIRAFLVFADRIGILHLFCPLSLLLHISTSYKFHTNFIALFPGSLVEPQKVIETVMPVQLQGSENDGLIPVVLFHEALDQVVGGLLHPGLLGIDQQTDVLLMTGPGHFFIAILNPLPLRLFRRAELPALRNLLIKRETPETRGLEHGEGNGFLLVHEIDDPQGFVQGRVELLLLFLALHGVVQDRVYSLLEHAIDHRHAVLLVDPSAEMIEHRRANEPFHGQGGFKGKLGDRGAHFHQGFALDESKQEVGSLKLRIGFEAESDFSIVE